MNNKYTYRHIVRLTIEAATPLAVGCGMSDVLTDALVIKDVNGLPYIPATGIAGVIRHALKYNEVDVDDLFGFQGFKEDDGKGSRVIFTDAKMVGKDGKVIDGLQNIDWKDEFYGLYATLPIRQHVRINQKGTAEDKGKFDEQVVYQGTRFMFEMELISKQAEDPEFEQLLNTIHSPAFRLGSGTRSGFGCIKVVSCQSASINFNKNDDMEAYLAKSSSLTESWSKFKEHAIDCMNEKDVWQEYTLQLKPKDFFLFSSGFGDEDADITPTLEKKVLWEDGKPKLRDVYVIPATSVKGAIAHRFLYHLNKDMGNFADKEADDDIKKVIKDAMTSLFGIAGDNEKDIVCGNMMIDDILLPLSTEKEDYKFFNHIAIDRFTGGVLGGALFTEKTTYLKEEPIIIKILVENNALTDDIKNAFEKTLKDIAKGLLPLGGGTSRGHGIFIGEIK